MGKPGRKKSIYALYYGDDILAVGTLDEIAAGMDMTYKTLLFISTNAYKKKAGTWKGPYKYVIKVEE